MFDRPIDKKFLESSQKFIRYINENHSKHSHLSIASRVFECLEYISENIPFIASHDSGKTPILRHPTNHLAFHLDGASEEITTYFTRLINEVHGCLDTLLAIEDEKTRHQIISIFLNYINDSDTGCMEYRLRTALHFYGMYQSSGVVTLESLMLEFSQRLADKEQEEITVEHVIDFFSEKVNFLLVKDSENETILLDWSVIKTSLIDIYMLDEEEFENKWLAFFNTSTVREENAKKEKLYTYYFEKEEEASRYFSYIKSILPASFQARLDDIEIELTENNRYTFTLSANEHITFVEITKNDFANEQDDEGGELVDAPARKIAYRLRKDPTLIKVIRADGRCFLKQFNESTTGEQIKGLRQGEHKNVTVYGNGVYNRKDKPSPYSPLSPEKIKRKKAKRSAFQSTTVITPKAPVPVFNHNPGEDEKLAGFLFDAKDAMVNRMLTKAVGSRKRPYEFHDMEQALTYFNKMTGILFADWDEFIQAVEKNPRQINEVLARIRWNMATSAAGIFADNFESRCIAHYYAEQMENRLKTVYEKAGTPWDNTYHVPIIYYLPGNNKNWDVYTQAEQLADRKKANEIFHDPSRMANEFVNDNFEFLLLVDNPDAAFNVKINEKPLVHYLLEKGKIQIVEAICKRSTLNENDLMQAFKPLPVIKTVKKPLDKKGKKKQKKQAKKEKKQAKKVKKSLYIDADKNTALHLAAELGHSTLKFILASQLFDVNASNKDKHTPLMLASMYDHAESVKLLLEDKNIDVNAVQKEGRTAAMLGVTSPDVMKILLSDARVNLKLTDKRKNTLLMLAAKKGNLQAIKVLLQHPAIETSIDDVNADGKTALMLAVENGHVDTVKLLLKRYSESMDLNAVDNNKNTLLMLAAENGELELVKILVSHNHIDAEDNTGRTAVIMAARKGHTEIVDYLIRCGASLEANARGISALSEAALYGKPQTKKYLETTGQHLYQEINAGVDHLFYAIRSNDMKAVNRLLHLGVPVNKKNDAGMTPIALAAYLGNKEAFTLLLGYGNGENYSNAFEMALKKNHTSILDFMLENNLVNLSEQKNSILNFALSNDVPEEALNFLLEKGMKIGNNEKEKAVLIEAVNANNISFANYLMLHGVEMDKRKLSSLLSHAKEQNHETAVNFLTLLIKGEKIKERAKEWNAKPVKISSHIAGLFYSYANAEFFTWQHHNSFALKVGNKLSANPDWTYTTCLAHINSQLSILMQQDKNIVDPQGTLAALLYQVSLLEYSQKEPSPQRGFKR